MSSGRLDPDPLELSKDPISKTIIARRTQHTFSFESVHSSDVQPLQHFENTPLADVAAAAAAGGTPKIESKEQETASNSKHADYVAPGSVRLGVPMHILRERHSRVKNKNRTPVAKQDFSGEEEIKHGIQPRALALRFEMTECPPAPSFTAEMNPEEMAKNIDDEMLRSVLDAQRCNLKKAKEMLDAGFVFFLPFFRFLFSGRMAFAAGVLSRLSSPQLFGIIMH